MKKLMMRGGLMLAAGMMASVAQAQTVKPTVVLVHGAFADSSSWNGVIAVLEHDGYKVIAAPDNLRGVRADADVVADVVKSVSGPWCWSAIPMADRSSARPPRARKT
jgi:pimeloyl-ACP methyl ester carboxylesterase